MGRVSRYKKIKACDPFAKKRNISTIDIHHDDPPEEFQSRGMYLYYLNALFDYMNAFYIVHRRDKSTKSLSLDEMSDLQKEKVYQKEALKELNKQKNLTSNIRSKLEEKKDSETMKDFQMRIRQQTRLTLFEHNKKLSSTAIRRKEQLKKRKLMKKAKKNSSQSEFDETDEDRSYQYKINNVEQRKLHEVAPAPPDLSQFQLKKKNQNEYDNMTASTIKKNKLHSNSQEMEVLRKKAMEAYAIVKQKRLSKQV